MKILVCGNPCEHEWPETCVRTLVEMGHEVELVYFLWPRDGQFEEFLPVNLRRDVPALLDSEEGRRALMELVFYNLAASFRPDLVLLAGMIHSWSADALADVRESLGVPVVLWSGDDPHEPWAPDVFGRAEHYDRVWFTIPGLAERVSERFRHVDYLPFACDPERDAPPAADSAALEPYACDLSYLGTLKLDRAQVLEEIARGGVDLKVWGVGFPEDLAARFPHLARARQPQHVQGREKALVYGASKIVLNLHHTGFGNMKFFEAASCGAFQLCNRRSEVEAAVDGLPIAAQVVAYEEPVELGALVKHYLEHEAERLQHAAELRAAVHASHTWRHRLETILEAVASPVGG